MDVAHMKGMVLREPGAVDRGPLRLEEAARPVAGEDELLVRVGACGVCRTDLHQVEGELPMRRSPVIPGHMIVGEVAGSGRGAKRFTEGDRVGAAWVHRTCGRCGFCASDRENLCEEAEFTGWTVDGGYAEYAVVPEGFAYAVPEGLSDEAAAPLMCAGIIGYRGYRAAGVGRGQRLGLYGFGNAAHVTIQVAVHEGCEVFVFTRSEENQALARRLGAAWTGSAEDEPPGKVDGAVVFAPAGEIVPRALEVVERGGTVVLAGIYMTPTPALEYRKHLYDEKCLRSVANARRADGEALLRLAGEIPIRTETEVFELERANEALAALKSGRVHGAAVLRC